LRRSQGRLNEMEASLGRAVEQYPVFPSLRCYLALLYAEIDRPADAKRVFEKLAADDFADCRRRYNWGLEKQLLAETCALIRDAPRAARLYELLLPFGHRLMY